MEVVLSKEDLISLVKGTPPSYSVMDHAMVEKHGSYSGSYDRWDWNSELKELSESELWELYNICKKSWKK